MRTAVFIFHYGTKTILSGDKVYQQIETAVKAQTAEDVYTIFCSHFLQDLIKKGGHTGFFTLNDFPALARKYQKIHCLSGFLTSGSEWAKVEALLKNTPQAILVPPLLESAPIHLTQLLEGQFHEQGLHDAQILFIGHGGEGAHTEGYYKIHAQIKKTFPQSHILMLEEIGHHTAVLQALSLKKIALAPLRLNSSPHNTQKIERLIIQPLKAQGLEPFFAYNRLADIKGFTDVFTGLIKT